ncbi:MAG: carboxypeptidase regulatory-like domain-containing protein [Nitrospirae bacterium]|nr:carboxypeptidase regulatory-like domain-containing protein [Nitrospirota bacterium]MBF0534638.1 carboxypeptidase regulatory-like domain-containing protein [Nitrospirota bacterium]MBF0616318.1 carboxypeptidase regulatory-like domain-containing protein [Nitrospirota bacterium]
MRLKTWGFLTVFVFIVLGGSAYGYDTVDVKNGATIKGVIKNSGAVPADEVINVTEDQSVCGKTINAGKYLISDSKVKNVVVFVTDVKKGMALPKKNVEITIDKCRVLPHVSLGFTGSEYVIKNNDPILHTVQLKLGLDYQKEISKRPLEDGSTILNLAFPTQGMELRKPIRDFHRFTKDTGYIRVKSNAHPWLRGIVFVFDHPYAAVSNEKGEYEITGLMSGKYTLRFWHEGFGEVEKTVVVSEGETKTLDVDLSNKSDTR